MEEIFVVRTWPGGPQRQMSDHKVSGTFIPVTPVQNHTFAGRYVCDGCQQPSVGVYRQDVSQMSKNRLSEQGPDWVCDSCLNGRVRVVRTPEQQEVQRAATASRFALRRQVRPQTRLEESSA
jgi:hypothetical protein